MGGLSTLEWAHVLRISQEHKKFSHTWHQLTQPRKTKTKEHTPPPILKQHIVLNVAQLKD